MKCDPSLECEFDLDGLPDGCTIHWNRLSSNGRHSEDDVSLELPNGLSIECGVYHPYANAFRVDVVFAKLDWHSIEHSWCRDASEAAEEIVRLSKKYMDEGLLSLARQVSDRRQSLGIAGSTF